MAGFWQRVQQVRQAGGQVMASGPGAAATVEIREAMRGAAAAIEGGGANYQRQDVQTDVRLDQVAIRRQQSQEMVH